MHEVIFPFTSVFISFGILIYALAMTFAIFQCARVHISARILHSSLAISHTIHPFAIIFAIGSFCVGNLVVISMIVYSINQTWRQGFF